MQILALLVAALTPMVIAPGLLFHFDITPKIIILLFGVSMMLFFCNKNVHNLRTLVSMPPGRWFAALIVAEWLSMALSTVFSTNSLFSLNGSEWRRYGLLTGTGLLLFALLLAAWLSEDRTRVRLLLRACTAAGALAAIYGILQYFGRDPFLPAKAYQAGEGAFTIVRPPGTLGHADYFAAWLVGIVFFGIALHELESKKLNKTLALAASTLAVVAIVLSGTRSALLGLLAGGIGLLVFRRRRFRIRTLAAPAALAGCFVVFFFSPAGLKLRARFHWSLEDVRGGARLMLWRDSLRMARQRPIAGFGPETFTSEFPRFESIELARAYPDFYHESPHNMFLDALASQGAIGMFLLLAFCSLGFYAYSRSKCGVTSAFAAGLVGILVCQQFVVFVVATSLYFYLLLAMLATAEPVTPAPDPPPRYRLATALPLSIAASLVLAIFAFRLLMADSALAIVRYRLDSADASGAAAAYQDALRWRPAGAGADLYYSRGMASLAARTPIFVTRLVAWRQALDAGVRATTTSEDRQNAWYNLAELLARRNDAAGVEQSLRNAIASAPNWFKPHWTLAQLLDKTGRPAEACAEAAAAVERDAGRNPEVSATWERLRRQRGQKP